MKRFSKGICIFLILVLAAAPLSGCSLFMDYQSDYLKYEESNFENIEYSRPNTERFYILSKDIEKNCTNVLRAVAVNDMFTEMVDIYNDMYAMISLLSIYTALDVTDTYYAEEYLFLQNELIPIVDEFNRIVSVLKDSRCAYMIEFYNGKDVWDYFSTYKEKDESEKELDSLKMQENELLTEYNLLASVEYAVPGYENLNGFSLVSADNLLSLEEAGQLFLAGYLDEETYFALQREIYLVKNEAYGDVYCRLVKVRNQIAANLGYSSYADYAYETLYMRQYGISDVKAFREYVKRELLPFYTNLYDSLDFDRLADGDAYMAKAYPENLHDIIRPIMRVISPEMELVYNDMLENALCSLEYSPTKAEMSFTTYIECYGLPYLFVQPSAQATSFDFFTVVHEFGHYYSFVLNSITEYNAYDLDASEVASQAYELIFAEYMGDIFKENEVASAEYRYLLLNILSSIISGCMYDEFQERVYALPNCSTEEINRIFGEIRTAYGSEFYDVGDGASLSWIDVTHNFIAPFYYISYATSAVAALQIWADEEAEDLYFTFVDNADEMFFLDNISACGLSDPFTPDTLKTIMNTIKTRCAALSAAS